MKKLTLAEMQAIARKRGGLCLSEKYEHSKSKLRWRCAEGHEWEAKPNNVRHGSWCPICKPKNMTWREYEKVVAALGKALFELAWATVRPKIAWGSSNKWVGASGFKHQIDVSFESPQDIVLVECKKWASTVDVPAFLTFFARVLDIKPKHEDKTVHGKIVTNREFDPGVKQLAAYYKIHLDLVRNASEFALHFKDFGVVGVADSGSGINTVAKINRQCSTCGRELVLTPDGNSYVCPYCSM
jgi:hypothetical protein